MFDTPRAAAEAYRAATHESERALAAAKLQHQRMREVEAYLRGMSRPDLVRALAMWRATLRDPAAHRRYHQQVSNLLNP